MDRNDMVLWKAALMGGLVPLLWRVASVWLNDPIAWLPAVFIGTFVFRWAPPRPAGETLMRAVSLSAAAAVTGMLAWMLSDWFLDRLL